MEYYAKFSYKYIDGEFWHGRICWEDGIKEFDKTYKKGEEEEFVKDCELLLGRRIDTNALRGNEARETETEVIE